MKIQINDFEFRFESEFQDCRSGFRHNSHLTVTWPDGKTSEAYSTCKYVNRTWEARPFLTVERRALDQLYFGYLDDLKKEHRTRKGSKKYNELVKNDAFLLACHLAAHRL